VLFNEQTSERPTGHDPDRDIRSLAHLKMLQSLANKLNRLSDVREIGEAIVSELRMLIDYHNCRVYVVEGGECVPVAVRGDLGAPEDEVMERLRIRVGRGVTGQVAETGRPVLLPNAVESKHYLAIPGTDPIDESVIAVPLRYGSRVIGVVFLSQLGLNQFDENDLRLLEVLSGHASVALENARLYESLRREAANAKAWLEFADAMSSADSFEEIGEKTVRIVARQMEVEQCSLWLEDARAGIYYCAAAVGYAGDVEAEDLARRRVTKDAAEAVIGDEKTPFVVTADDVRERLFAGDERVRPRAGALAPLHQGYGVRGWIGVRAAPEHFSQSRLYLLEGLSFRASVAMQKALLYGNQQECAQVANAMLDFARALAEADELEEIYERIVERAAQILNLEEVSLWLQEVITGELRAVTVWDECDDSRAKLLAQGFTAEIGEAFVDAPEPFVLTPEEYEHIPAAPELGRGRRVAVAPFRFDGGRMGFLVGADADDGRFDELLLKMLAGLADQAKIAIANAR